MRCQRLAARGDRLHRVSCGRERPRAVTGDPSPLGREERHTGSSAQEIQHVNGSLPFDVSSAPPSYWRVRINGSGAIVLIAAWNGFHFASVTHDPVQRRSS